MHDATPTIAVFADEGVGLVADLGVPAALRDVHDDTGAPQWVACGLLVPPVTVDHRPPVCPFILVKCLRETSGIATFLPRRNQTEEQG